MGCRSAYSSDKRVAEACYWYVSTMSSVSVCRKDFVNPALDFVKVGI